MSTPINITGKPEILDISQVVKQVKSDESKGYLDFRISFGVMVVTRLGLQDSDNSTRLGLIISSKLANQLEIKIDKSKAPNVGSAHKGQTLKIIGQSLSLTLETRLENGKLFSFSSTALVFDNLDNGINIGLTDFNKNSPIIFHFEYGQNNLLQRSIIVKQGKHGLRSDIIRL